MATIRKRTRKNGSVSYYAEIRIKRSGQVVYRESQTWGKKKLAQQWAAKREAYLNEPGVLDAVISGSNENNKKTISELIADYVEHVYPLKPWSKTKSDTLRLLSESELGKIVAVDFVAADLIEHCKNWGASPSTMNQHYLYIKGIFSVAEELLRVPVNYQEIEKAQRVMSRLGLIAKSGERDRRPTIDEITRIVRYAWESRQRQKTSRVSHRNDIIPMDKIVAFAMFSGRRQAEITRITRSGTDSVNKRVLITDMKHPSKKQGNDVWVSVPDEAWRVLMSMPKIEGEDRYFPHFSKTLGDRFIQIQKELGLWVTGGDNLRFHDLRHECASWLFERDGYNGERWDVSRVAAVTGHKNWNSLKRYTQIERIEPNNKWESWQWLDKICES